MPRVGGVLHLLSSLRTFKRFMYGSPPPPVPKIPQPAHGSEHNPERAKHWEMRL